jgi:hypothetical protein
MEKGDEFIKRLLILISVLLILFLVVELFSLTIINDLKNTSNLKGELATLSRSSSTYTSSSSSSSSSSTIPPDFYLRAYYKFENNALDSLGKYNGTIYGNKTFIYGKSGKALNFDGNTTYVSLGNVLTSDMATFTIGAWIKLSPGALQKPQNYIFHKNDDMPGMSIGSDGKVYYCKLSAGTGACFASSIKINESTWYYISYTFDGTTFKGYINAQLVGSLLNSVGTKYSPGTIISLGKDEKTPSYNRFFKGAMDEIKIWNKALSSSEIMTEYTYLSITRKISGNTITLNILKYKPLLENEIIMIAEELPVGTSIVSSNIAPNYNNTNIMVWLFSSNSGAYFEGFSLNILPNSITYTVSKTGVSGIKGKWTLRNTNEEGVIN